MKALFSNLEMTLVKRLIKHLQDQGETRLDKILFDFNSPITDIESIVQRLEGRGVIGYRIEQDNDLPRIFVRMIMQPTEVEQLIISYGKLKVDI